MQFVRFLAAFPPMFIILFFQISETVAYPYIFFLQPIDMLPIILVQGCKSVTIGFLPLVPIPEIGGQKRGEQQASQGPSAALEATHRQRKGWHYRFLSFGGRVVPPDCGAGRTGLGFGLSVTSHSPYRGGPAIDETAGRINGLAMPFHRSGQIGGRRE